MISHNPKVYKIFEYYFEYIIWMYNLRALLLYFFSMLQESGNGKWKDPSQCCHSLVLYFKSRTQSRSAQLTLCMGCSPPWKWQLAPSWPWSNHGGQNDSFSGKADCKLQSVGDVLRDFITRRRFWLGYVYGEQCCESKYLYHHGTKFIIINITSLINSTWNSMSQFTFKLSRK